MDVVKLSRKAKSKENASNLGGAARYQQSLLHSLRPIAMADHLRELSDGKRPSSIAVNQRTLGSIDRSPQGALRKSSVVQSNFHEAKAAYNEIRHIFNYKKTSIN